MSAGRNLLIASGRALSRVQRPVTLIYAGHEISASSGNLDFFEQINPDGAGFSVIKSMSVTVLRSALPQVVISGTATDITFKRGERITVRDEDSGDEYLLTIGSNNHRQAEILILNLNSTAA